MQPRRTPVVRRHVAAVLACLLAIACGAPDGPTAVIERQQGGPVRVALEVASTRAAVEHGLMYRTELADGRGMLFVFEQETEHSFWMKNTLIPLDMLFIAREGSDRGRVVGIAANTTPMSTAPITVGKPSAWVLEVPGGWSARAGVRAGDRVLLVGVPQRS